MLLYYCNALPDGIVFDKQLQAKIVTKIIREEGNESHDGSKNKTFNLVRSFSKVEMGHTDIIERQESVPYEAAHEFFSKIPSHGTLERVIRTIFVAASKRHGSAMSKIHFPSDEVSMKIWDLYKHTEKNGRKRRS